MEKAAKIEWGTSGARGDDVDSTFFNFGASMSVTVHGRRHFRTDELRRKCLFYDSNFEGVCYNTMAVSYNLIN